MLTSDSLEEKRTPRSLIHWH